MPKSAVTHEIREAFASETLPVDEPVAVKTYCDEGASLTLKGRRWQQVSEYEIANVSACLNFLSPPAVRAYLAAFLVTSIAAPLSGIADSTVAFVKPPKGNPSRPSYFSWWSLLSQRQRTVVIAFLRAMPESMPGEHAEAIKALEASVNAS